MRICLQLWVKSVNGSSDLFFPHVFLSCYWKGKELVVNSHHGQILAVPILGHKNSLHSLVKEGLCVRRDVRSVCET